jgi:hypothetical protein
MIDIDALFPATYESSRERFRKNLSPVQALWPNARLVNHRIAEGEDLAIDWIHAEPLERYEKLLIFTTGEHGIECYVGSAMLQRFIEAYLPRLNPKNTALLLVHGINPWGMKHWRRTNANNVDLNRNFVWSAEALDPAFNPDYTSLDSFLNPQRPISNYFVSTLNLAARLLWHWLTIGRGRFWTVARLGQYRHPKGIHYGGGSLQEETRVLTELYQEAFQKFAHILHLDMHTGYGPRYQMSLVNSYLEPRSSREIAQACGYPLVVATTPDEFYAIQGDMIDYIYTLFTKQFPHRRLYATSFEFGTLGGKELDRLRSLRAMIFENQVHWFGAANPRIHGLVAREFQELFGPLEEKWRAKAVADADQAFAGILRAEGFI